MIRYPVDLSLFAGNQHSPSFFSLQRSMKRPELQLHDFCIPVNPYFPPPETFNRFRDNLETLLKYYPSPNEELAHLLGEVIHVQAASLVMANGSTELISWISHLLVNETLVTTIPTFGRWTDYPKALGKNVVLYRRRPEVDHRLDIGEFIDLVRTSKAKAVALCNPNNPTGAVTSKADLMDLINALEDLDVIIVDESFIDFVQETDVPTLAREAIERENVIVIKSLGKNFGLHGIRAGYAITNPTWASGLREVLPRWNVNSLAEALLLELRQHWEEYEVSRRQVIRDARYLKSQISTIPELTVYPSQANFVYCRLDSAIEGVEWRNRLLQERGCFVRECGNKLGSDQQHFRIASRPKEQIDLLMNATRETLAQRESVLV